MNETDRTPRWMRAVGWLLTGLIVLFMGGMGTVAMFSAEMTRPMTDQYGYPAGAIRVLLVAEVLAAILFAIPRTAAIGAILITGYLGGAIATHVRAVEPTWPMPAVMAVLAWLALYFRDARVRAIMPWHR